MNYRKLSIQENSTGDFSLVPVRMEDREAIRTWRNEQMYHLRQNKPLTEADQTRYFNEVVMPLFSQEHPEQYLFSYLKNGECIGYGGLVHINYKNQSAELSFIMKTSLERQAFRLHWSNFLTLIEPIAFTALRLNRIFTYAYDLRPHLYPVLTECGFQMERCIEDALLLEGKKIQAVVHSKWNARLRKAEIHDIELTYTWASMASVRQYAFNQDPITKDGHSTWFTQKINQKNCLYFMLDIPNQTTIGSIRIDINPIEKVGLISYLIDPKFQGKGWGVAILVLGQSIAKEHGITCLIGEVMPENSSSCAIFVKLGYEATVLSDRIRYQKIL